MAIRYTERTYHRFPVEVPVDYLGRDFVGKGIARNLSREGLRLEGQHTAQPGMTVAISVLLFPGGPVKVQQAVVR